MDGRPTKLRIPPTKRSLRSPVPRSQNSSARLPKEGSPSRHGESKDRVASLRPDHHQLVCARLRAPHFPGSAKELPDVGGRAREWKYFELLRRGIKPFDGIRSPIAYPGRIRIVHEDRVRFVSAGNRPLPPLVCARIVECQLAGVPFAHPDPAK